MILDDPGLSSIIFRDPFRPACRLLESALDFPPLDPLSASLGSGPQAVEWSRLCCCVLCMLGKAVVVSEEEEEEEEEEVAAAPP